MVHLQQEYVNNSSTQNLVYPSSTVPRDWLSVNHFPHNHEILFHGMLLILEMLHDHQMILDHKMILDHAMILNHGILLYHGMACE